MKLTRTSSRRWLTPPLFWVHGPGLVLKEDANWRTINGVAFRIRDTTYWLEVR